MSLPALVDAHLHLWDPEVLHYSWLEKLPELNRAFSMADLDRELQGIEVEAAVFVQCDCSAEQGEAEVDWVTTLAGEDARIQGIVAFAPLESDCIEQLRRYCDHSLVKGVRRLLQDEDDLDFILQPPFLPSLRALADLDLSFDLCIRHPQMPAATELIRQCPEVSFVLDHAGKPGIRDQLLQPWTEHLRAMAELPNVVCKLSGLLTEADPNRWRPADLRPYVQTILDSFGENRVLYGGDWPVMRLAGRYPNWPATLDRLLGDLPEPARQAIFSENARRVYRLTP